MLGAAGRPVQGLPPRQGRRDPQGPHRRPGQAAHALARDRHDRKNTPVHNAPMTLADVDGDFMAQVEVTGEINPGDSRPSDRAVRNLKFTFQSAGLILYQDKNNFIRLERAASIFTERLTPVHRLIDRGRPGRQAGHQADLPRHPRRRHQADHDPPQGADPVPVQSRRGSDSVHTFREFALELPQQGQGRPGRRRTSRPSRSSRPSRASPCSATAPRSIESWTTNSGRFAAGSMRDRASGRVIPGRRRIRCEPTRADGSPGHPAQPLARRRPDTRWDCRMNVEAIRDRLPPELHETFDREYLNAGSRC